MKVGLLCILQSNKKTNHQKQTNRHTNKKQTRKNNQIKQNHWDRYIIKLTKLWTFITVESLRFRVRLNENHGKCRKTRTSPLIRWHLSKMRFMLWLANLSFTIVQSKSFCCSKMSRIIAFKEFRQAYREPQTRKQVDKFNKECETHEVSLLKLQQLLRYMYYSGSQQH